MEAIATLNAIDRKQTQQIQLLLGRAIHRAESKGLPFKMVEDKYDREPSKHDRALGAQVLGLISDWDWMKRRVESIRVLDDGYTERQLSLDFQLEYNPALLHPSSSSETGDSKSNTKQVAVPVSFLGKGMLVNLSLRDSSGDSIPALGFSENGRLTFEALCFLLEQTTVLQNIDDLHDCFTEGLGNPQKFNLGHLLNQGIGEVIFSEKYDESAISYDKKNRYQETHRRDLFGSLAATAAALRPSAEENRRNKICSSAFPNPAVTFSYWPLGGPISDANETWKHHGKDLQNEMTPKVLDSSFSVHILALGILRAIARAEVEELKTLELLCSFLSIASTSYLCAVALDTDKLWPQLEEAPGKALSKRTVLKLKCDVEVTNNDSDRSQSCFLRPIKLLFKNPKPFLDIILRSSVRSAESTHVELTFPEKVQLRSIKAFQSMPRLRPAKPCGGSAEIEDEVHFGTVTRIHRKSWLFTPLSSPESRLRPEYKARAEPRYRHGSYRSSLNRVHVKTNERTSPLETLSIRLVPEPMWQPSLAVLTAVVSLLFGVAVFLFKQFAGSDEVSTALSLSNFIATITLLTALFGAYGLTGHRHSVIRQLYELPSDIIIVSSGVGLLAPALLWIYSLVPSQPEIDWLRNIVVFLYLLLAAILVRLVCLAFLFHRNTKRDFKQIYEERIISEVVSDQKFGRNVVAITETGAYDVDYLDDAFLVSLGIGVSAEDYYKDLAKFGTSIAGRGEQND